MNISSAMISTHGRRRWRRRELLYLRKRCHKTPLINYCIGNTVRHYTLCTTLIKVQCVCDDVEGRKGEGEGEMWGEGSHAGVQEYSSS